MTVETSSVRELCRAAKVAAAALGLAERSQRDAALEALARALERDAGELHEASRRDAEACAAEGAEERLHRPQLSERRIAALAERCRRVAAEPDPLGAVLERRSLADGSAWEKRRVPLGVVAWVFRARPHTAIEAAALCLKAGSAIVLHGDRSTRHANAALAALAGRCLEEVGLPPACVTPIPDADERTLRELVVQDGLVDLVKQRGGASLRGEIGQLATVPVVYAIDGNCHVYVDASADAAVAREVAVAAKVDGPGVCDAAETLLVHAAVAGELLPALLRDLRERGVSLRCDERSLALARAHGIDADAATDADWDEAFYALVLAVRVVDSLDEAVAHVARHGVGHAEAIVTSSREAAEEFAARVDAACVYVNASTRRTTGEELGLGPDFGNSTQKLPVRGPIALPDLTTVRYVVRGPAAPG